MSAVVIDLNEVVPSHGVTQRYDLDLIVQRLRDTA
jgi:putative DNA primase/helicase